MVLEGAVKYLIATITLFISLLAGWFVSAKYLEPVIFKFFTPETHDKYLDIWFLIFVLVELIIVMVYIVYVYKTYKSQHHLTKPSN